MKLGSLEDLYVDQLKDLLDAEKQIIKALPKMAKATSSPELQNAFQQHLEQTKGQLQRLEQIFDKSGRPARGKKCKAMEGIIEEGKELMDQDADDDVLNAGLIAAAQKVEHYEIAGYGCVRTYAETLGDREAASLLQQTLDEEKQTDEKLTQLAERLINVRATEGQAVESSR